jgi:hypothetical protein
MLPLLLRMDVWRDNIWIDSLIAMVPHNLITYDMPLYKVICVNFN